jgi:post-segregation antitoxin (ccd killing protein)
MSAPLKRTTVYLDPDLYKAMRLKAVAVSRSVSDLINEAIRESLKKEKTKYRYIMDIMSKQGLEITKPKKP